MNRHPSIRMRTAAMFLPLAAILWMLAGTRATAQPADDCKELARRSCASLTATPHDSLAYRIVYELLVRKRDDSSGLRPIRLVECFATHDFIWSRGDSLDILRGREETIVVNKPARTIYRSDGRLSEHEVETRIRTTTFLQDTLFALLALRSCRDSAGEVPLRIINLRPAHPGAELGTCSSITLTIDRTDSTLRSILFAYLGARDGVIRREIVLKEPPHLVPYRADRDRPVVLDAATGQPAPAYRGFRVVDLRNRTRN
jgi:hypothetical protein